MITDMFQTEVDKIETEKGITLIEILLSLVILSIVIVAYLTLFSNASKDNRSILYKSRAVYTAQSCMETAYEGSTKYTFEEFRTTLMNDPGNGFVYNAAAGEFQKTKDGYFVRVKFTHKKDKLYRVLVLVYGDAGQTELLAQNEGAFIFK